MLQFDEKLRFQSPGTVDPVVDRKIFSQVINRIKGEFSKKYLFEIFKEEFANASDRPYYSSSGEDWARGDLKELMHHASENSVLYIDALYNGIVVVNNLQSEKFVPDWSFINKILEPTGFAVEPPHLVSADTYKPVQIQPLMPSLNDNAQKLVQDCVDRSEAHLKAGDRRAAVHEILWLLETVLTAFKGVEVAGVSIGGNYFIEIIKDLRRHNRGKTLDQVIGWLTNLYGYVSSPTGGAIRHGTDINSHADLTTGEARLYCDLARSYINYFLHEHERISKN